MNQKLQNINHCWPQNEILIKTTNKQKKPCFQPRISFVSDKC